MKKGHILIFTVLSILAVSCSRYDENPAFNLLPVKMRLTNTWEIEKYLDNGSDNTDNYKGLLPGYQIELTSEDSYVETANYPIIGGSWTNNGSWSLSDDKSQIIFTGDKEGTYTIVKLTSKELWIQDIDGNDVQEVHLTPVE